MTFRRFLWPQPNLAVVAARNVKSIRLLCGIKSNNIEDGFGLTADCDVGLIYVPKASAGE